MESARAADEDSKESPKLNLLSPIKIGKFKRLNRIAMAPMTRGRATEQFVPTKMMIQYYSMRADCGLIISEGTGISAQGLGWFRAPGIWTDEMVEKWKPITEAVHNNNGLIALQLWHLGRKAHSDVTGTQIVSASNIPSPGQVTARNGVKKDNQVPHALDEKEIEGVVKDYGQAAINGTKAGFDMFELHGANGYLIDQFLQSASNKRDDKYGGSIENRLRFMQEAVACVIESAGDSRKVGIRLSPNGKTGGMGGADNLQVFDAAIEWLAQQKLGYIHLMDGLSWGFHEKCEAYTLERAKSIMQKYDKDMILMGNVGYTKKTADEKIETGEADMISFGRPYIANPDLVTRFEKGIDLAPEAEYKTWWGVDMNEKGYIDWPTAAEEQAAKAKQSESSKM